MSPTTTGWFHVALDPRDSSALGEAVHRRLDERQLALLGHDEQQILIRKQHELHAPVEPTLPRA